MSKTHKDYKKKFNHNEKPKKEFGNLDKNDYLHKEERKRRCHEPKEVETHMNEWIKNKTW